MRPSKHEYYMGIAKVVASRSTCARRHVGCVLVNSRGHVLATGYNGVPRHMEHCRDNPNTPCTGKDAPSGTALDKCQAVHAEQNALIQVRDADDIEMAYCTTSPCIHCVKMLLNTSCSMIVYDQEYPHLEAQFLWQAAGRFWCKL